MKYLAALSALVALPSALAAEPSHVVDSLPGWDAQLPSKHYSGYLNITQDKHLHYYFVESENDPKNDPVVLWMNGGPGCSSLDGFLYEHGPFRINKQDFSKLDRFPQTWASKANMIYLEAPVGVGFSYSDNEADYVVNDDTTADDNLLAVMKFFELFPEYKSHRFFITGESYGGVYVPTLAESIMKADKQGKYTGAKLNGIAVGNGCTGSKLGVCGGERDKYEIEYLIGQAFVDPELAHAIRNTCDLTTSPLSAKCEHLVQTMYQNLGTINIYNVYGECPTKSEERVLKAPLGENTFHKNKWGNGLVECLDSRYASKWMNREVVYKAMHVKKPSFEWAICANRIKYTSNRENLPRDTYPDLIDYTRVVIYNGDWDACVPYNDNMAWTRGMGYPVKKHWHPWTYASPDMGPEQVGGYAVEYDAGKGFSFVTIRGGRHEVPETAPNQALELLDRLINEKPF